MTKKTSTPTKPPGRKGRSACAATTMRTATARSPWMSPRSCLAIAPSPTSSLDHRRYQLVLPREVTLGRRAIIPDVTTYRIAVMGGTGPQGKGLGYRFARHGHDVVIGSRAAEKAASVAEEVSARLGGVPGAGRVTGAANADACADADVVLLAVPW